MLLPIVLLQIQESAISYQIKLSKPNNTIQPLEKETRFKRLIEISIFYSDRI